MQGAKESKWGGVREVSKSDGMRRFVQGRLFRGCIEVHMCDRGKRGYLTRAGMSLS